MSELPISSKYRSTPDAPVSDGEREELTQRLNDAFEAGKFDQETYSSRLDQLYAARRLGELVPVVEGLPPAQTYADPEVVQQAAGGRPGELAPSRSPNRLGLVLIAAIVLIAIIIAILVGVIL